MERDVRVFADWIGLASPTQMGILHESSRKGRSAVSFEYDTDWLKQQDYIALDPELQLYVGRQYPPTKKPLFGVFTDSAPDQWGRMLIKRREASEARREGRSLHRFSEIDYVLEVSDIARMGALRFRIEERGPFVAPEIKQAVPPWTKLRTLEEAAHKIESDEDSTDDWLNLLIAPGSSLGGAGPKASVQAPDGSLWIAKFPSKNDSSDTGKWEKLVYDLAGQCGLATTESTTDRFSVNGTTFLTKRFDRTTDGRRIHFASALTLLGKTDGASAEDGSGYLELAEFIRQSGSRPRKDLHELWSRIVFSIAVSNTDDHLRNHGFLLDKKGWKLSPLFDVNPNPEGVGMSLNINEDENALDFHIALGIADQFFLTDEQADERMNEITTTVCTWKDKARAFGFSASAIDDMAPAFRVE